MQVKNSSEQDKQQTQILPFYREVDISDLLSQYTEDIETFRQILNLCDPRDTIPRSSIWALVDEKANRSLGQGTLQLCSR